jgi:hypothetical protein
MTHVIPPPPAEFRTGRPGELEPETAEDARHDAGLHENQYDGLMGDAEHHVVGGPATDGGEESWEDDPAPRDVAAVTRAGMATAAAGMATAARIGQVAATLAQFGPDLMEANGHLRRIADSLEEIARQGRDDGGRIGVHGGRV